VLLTFGQFQQQRRRGSPLALAVTGLLLCAAAATAVILFEHHRLRARSGLSGDYRAGAGWDTKPDRTLIDNGISAELVRRRSQDRNGSAFTVTWRGYLIAPQRDRYRFSILADDHAWIEVDKRPVIDSDRRRREAAIELARGLHPITIRYYDGFGLQDLDVRWAQGNHPTDQIPRLLLVPQLISGEEAQHRIRINRFGSTLPVIWSGLIAALIAAAIVRRCTFPAGFDRRIASEMVPLYLAALIVFVVGISWGLPDYRGWAVDEITPGRVEDILEYRFTHAWATIYPPLHFGVLSLAFVPVYAATAAGMMNDTLETYSGLFIIGRIVSIAMALCILAFVYRLTLDEFGHRAARFAVIVTLLLLPLTYYAKTANLDVPYLFWLTASWLFYLRAVRTGSILHACFFAATGAAAIATKDQAYGFYVLPAAHLACTAVRKSSQRPENAFPGMRALYAMAAAFAVTLVILFNVPFNLAGVIEHLRLIVGPGSQPFRMYPRSVTGYAQLLRDSVWQIGSVMSWPMFGFALCGVAAAIREKSVPISRLLLSALSYYLTFIVIVMYHYDRFFIGICLVLAIAAGVWLDRSTREGLPYRRLRLALVSVAIVYGAARGISLDALMLNDSRYYVERWLVPRIGPDTQIAAEGASLYLPRESLLLWRRIDADPAALRELQPQFLILNAGYRTRTSPGPGPKEFYRSLGDGTAGYRQVLSYRTWLRFSPLRWESRFNGPGEDQFSNVTKVNPTIEVYERVDTAMPRR
jgi:PA14 domain